MHYLIKTEQAIAFIRSAVNQATQIVNQLLRKQWRGYDEVGEANHWTYMYIQLQCTTNGQ